MQIDNARRAFQSRFHGVFTLGNNHKEKLRERSQMEEVMSVMREADAIENLHRKHGIPLPKVYNLFTAGFNKPDEAVIMGVYGDKTFKKFPKPDIYGHDGTVSQKGELLFLNGRAHPNEHAGDEYAAMVVAHPLQVLKELARRQRAQGVDPLFILTYLTGVREGQAMKPGDLGLIIDDAELTNIVHPGHGPRSILDQYFGAHFQPKAGRNKEEAKTFADFAKKYGYKDIFPVAGVGTPGTTEYQGYLEIGLLDTAFEKAKENLGILAEQIFGEKGKEKLSLLFGMGITSELATLRQTLPGEDDFRVLAFGLATDLVGGAQSLVIDHKEVVAAAFANGEKHRDMLLKYGESDAKMSLSIKDFSIRKKFQEQKKF